MQSQRIESDCGCLHKVARFQHLDATRTVCYFCPRAIQDTMGHDHDHHDHSEAEQNEIGGPVVFALFLFAIVITAIWFLS